MSNYSQVMPRSKFKLVFVGDSSVGKTSIISRFMYNHFDLNYQATIGIDFLSKTLYLNDRVVRLQLWDTAGQERFRSLIPSYIRDSSVAIVVFSVDNRQSFENVDNWVSDVRNERGYEVVIMLVGNKTDLPYRDVLERDGEEKARELGVLYIEASAKDGTNVKQLFRTIAKNLPSSEVGDKNSAPRGVSFHNKKDIDSGKCLCSS